MTEQLVWLEVEPAADGVRTFVLSLDGEPYDGEIDDATMFGDA